MGDREVVENAMNLAIAHIQNQLGQDDGGFASHHFTEFAPTIPDVDIPGYLRQLPEWSEIVDRLVFYMEAERRNMGPDNGVYLSKL